jgi:hypothetical protein
MLALVACPPSWNDADHLQDSSLRGGSKHGKKGEDGSNRSAREGSNQGKRDGSTRGAADASVASAGSVTGSVHKRGESDNSIHDVADLMAFAGGSREIVMRYSSDVLVEVSYFADVSVDKSCVRGVCGAWVSCRMALWV